MIRQSSTVGETWVRRPVSPGRLLLAVGVLLATASFAEQAAAQDFDRYRPLEPRNLEGEAKLPEEPKPAKGDEAVLVESWKAVIFVPHRDLVVEKPEAEGVVIGGEYGLQLLRSSSFRRIASKYLDGPISLRQLNELAREVILFYRRNDQPVVDVSFPEQDLATGIVQVVVTEGRIGKVCVKDARHFDPNLLLRQVYTGGSDRIYESVLLEDLRWLNRNPFREVDLTLEPGKEFGETDVVFNVKDRCPVRGYLGYEDTGTRETDLERLIFGANWGNALWRDHQMAYQYTASPDFETLQAHTAVYEIPLINRDILLVYGAYATAETSPDPFHLEGRSWQTSVRYRHYFERRRNWERYFVVGFDFKQTNNNLDFGGSQVFLGSADIPQIAVGYHATRVEEDVAMGFGADMYVGLEGFSSGASDADYNTIRALAAPDYLYTRMFLEYRRRLPNCWTFYTRLTGQMSNRNLLPSETLAFGGFYSIRGYDMYFRAGDAGYVLNTELRTQPISLGLGRAKDEQLQGLLFWDIGQAWVHTRVAATDPDGLLMSGIGVGARYFFSRNFSLRCDYGWQLNRIFPDLSRGSRLHMAAVASY